MSGLDISNKVKAGLLKAGIKTGDDSSAIYLNQKLYSAGGTPFAMIGDIIISGETTLTDSSGVNEFVLLACDGSTISAVTYPLLVVALGGTTLPNLADEVGSPFPYKIVADGEVVLVASSGTPLSPPTEVVTPVLLVDAIVKDYDRKLIDNDLIQGGDKRLICNGDIDIVANDEIDVNGIIHAVIDVQVCKPSNVALAYQVQIRRQ